MDSIATAASLTGAASPLRRLPPRPRRRPISASSSSSSPADPDDNRINSPLRLLHLSATLTLLAPALRTLAAPTKPSTSPSPTDLASWSTPLPSITARIPYTHLLSLHRSNQLLHIVTLPSALRHRPAPVLAILANSQVLRTVLPSSAHDPAFWQSWDSLNLNSQCIKAYTPPFAKPHLPSPYLASLFKLLRLPVLSNNTNNKKKSKTKTKTLSKRAIELEKAKQEVAERRKAEVMKSKQEKEAMEKAIKMQRKAEERERRVAKRKEEYEVSVQRARENYKVMALKWASVAEDPNVAFLLGFVFLGIFYRTVVYNYKRQKQDFDDRLKIEKADAEERRKMRMMEMEQAGVVEEDEVEGEGGKGEEENYLKIAKQFMQSGARVRRVRGKRLPQYLERGADVMFTDVAGLGNIRIELEEIVKFFTMGEMYRRRGVKIPGGILLCGPPGVGKTLLAKAVAGEAGVNFFSISASQFVEIYVGVGASRVRALYQEARENAPSVVFIDELDAVGRERGLIKGSGGQERDATLNQLLVCLDGFEGRGEVITIAATNRPDILDPALVRPGRFDRKIYIPRPSLTGRVEILKVHAQKKPMAEDVDYVAVAGMTDGMVGAELANILEVAAINMMREGRSEITTDDLLQAAQIEERGMLDKKERSPEMWKRLALNEAAMAVVAVNFPDLKNIEFVTIAPRAGRELGYVRVKMDNMKFLGGMLSRQSLVDHITVQIAPRAADEIWYGENQLSTIWAETADNARSAARSLVLGGLSEKYYGLSDFWVTDRINEIDLEALQILNSCYERAKGILQRNRKLMDAVVSVLVEKKSLTKHEFSQLVEENGHLEPIPPSIIDIRNAKKIRFQEMMMSRK